MKALTIVAAILLLAGLVATSIGIGFTIFIGT